MWKRAARGATIRFPAPVATTRVGPGHVLTDATWSPGRRGREVPRKCNGDSLFNLFCQDFPRALEPAVTVPNDSLAGWESTQGA
jgi:hypothetical protein